MDKVKCFLHDPGVMDAVLQAAVEGGLEKAVELKAKQGVIVASIAVGGKVDSKAQALGGDVGLECDTSKKWKGDPKTGINYFEYAMGKTAQTLRTSNPSREGNALGYGESDDVGSDCERFYCINCDGEKVIFLLIVSYSGASCSQEDHQISRAACDSAWDKMFKYQNSDGSDTNFSRVIG